MAAQDQRFSDLERSLADAARLIGESKREIKRSQGLLQDQVFRTPAVAMTGIAAVAKVLGVEPGDIVDDMPNPA
jgi:hypothetical protein